MIANSTVTVARDFSDVVPKVDRCENRLAFPPRDSSPANRNMVQDFRQIPEITDADPANLPLGKLLADARPCVLRGLVTNWQITQAANRSDREVVDQLGTFYNGKPIGYSIGGPEVAGRLFYNDDFTKLNFSTERGRLDDLLARILGHVEDARPPTIYVGSAPVDTYLPGFRQANDLDFRKHGVDAPPAIWIGNRTIASCHYDAPNNIACCVAGRRRFTLFPPDQIFNLYPGPLEPTPGGQAISLVDFSRPDFDRFPRFRMALESAMSAELGPGDAIFVPSMWWHHVEGLSRFNILVNYWWSQSPPYIPTPMHALYHAMWTIRDRPESEKQAWRNVFDYYVFGPRERATEHLPPAAHGDLGAVDDDQARRMRAMLINKLNR
jgi:Cupin-like domain